MDISNPPAPHTIHYFALTGDMSKLSNLINNSATPIDSLDSKDQRTPLHYACWGGMNDSIKYLLDKGANTNAKDIRGCTPLQNAALKGYLESLKLLVEKGAEINTQDLEGVSPLHRASLLSSPDCIQYLLSKGADVMIRTFNGDTPLHYASASGNVQCIEILVKNGSQVEAADQDGVTSLHQAAFCGHADSLSTLLKKGAKVDSKDHHGLSPLHNAACAGHVACVELLVASGENINTVDTEGVAPLHQASFNGHLQCTKKLVELGAKIDIKDETGETPLHKASFNGHIECARVFIDSGVFVDSRDLRQATPLHLACYNGLAECASFLIDKGADFDSRDDEGASPIHKSSFNGHNECTKLLISKGCSVNMKDNEGATPLHKAAFNGKRKCVKTLIKHNASVEATDNQGGTPLHNAAYNGHQECVSALLQKGAKIDTKDSRGCTPLHLAAAVGCAKAVEDLIRAGADLDAQNQSGKTALAYAIKRGHPQVARMLIRAGSNVNNKDHKNRSSIDLSKMFGTLDPEEIMQLVNSRNSTSIGVSRISSSSSLSKPPPKTKTNEIIALSPTPTIDERKRQLLRQIVTLFNAKPSKGIEMAITNGFISENTPQEIAKFLLSNEEFSKKKIGELLGEGDEFNVKVLKAFVELMEFGSLDFDIALRKYLSKFRLPGEAQKIDRMMEAFAQQYYSQNPGKGTFQNSDTVYVLAFSVLMLHTDAHNPNIKKKMTKSEFLRNNSGINNGEDLPAEFMEELYDKIVSTEIKMETDDATRFTNAEKKGWLTKQGGRIKTWKRRWFILSNHCLFYFKSPTDIEPCGIIPLENLVVTPADMGRKKACFVLHHESRDEMKACKVNNDGTLVKANHASYYIAAANEPEMESWVTAIQSNIHKNPFLELLEKKEAQVRKKKPDTEIATPPVTQETQPNTTSQSSTQQYPSRGEFSIGTMRMHSSSSSSPINHPNISPRTSSIGMARSASISGISGGPSSTSS